MNASLIPKVRAVEPVVNRSLQLLGMIAGLDDGRIVLFRPDRPVVTLERFGAPVSWLRFDAFRPHAMAADAAGNLLVDWPTGLQRLAWERPIMQAASFGGDRYVAVDADARVVDWAPSDGPARYLEDAQGQPLRAHGLAVRDDDGSLVLRRGLGWTRLHVDDDSPGQRFVPVDGMDLRQQNGDVGLTRDGRHFYVYWDELQVFDTASGELVRETEADWYVYATSLSNDGRFLAMGGKAGWLGVTGPDGRLVAELQAGRADVTRAVIGRDGAAVAWCDRDGNAGLVDVATSRQLLSAEQVAALLRLAPEPGPNRGGAVPPADYDPGPSL